MSMATDDERREVARRLRGLDIPVRVKKAEHHEKAAAWYELICSAVGGKKDPWFGIKALADRLADLIEPPTQCPYYHSDRHYCSVHEDMASVDCDTSATHTDAPATLYLSQMRRSDIDREALLALADELEEETGSVCGVCMGKAARRIRKALGEG